MTPLPAIVDRPTSILIVDDERSNRQLMELMLTPEGFHLMTAASGEEALAMVAEQPPDLILLDIMMPGMDGYEVASRIKDNVATRDIPVIMITALGDRDARMLGLQAGAEGFLTKPVDRAELVVRVRNLSRLKAAGDSRHHLMLENEVGSRTADLVTRTVTLEQQATDREEAAVALERIRQDQLKFKDDFLSHVSHELRSPLTAIKQFTSILLAGLAGELNQEQRQYQEIVLKNIGQLQSMIDDLLEVTRLETGKLTIELESVSLADAVADTFNTLQETARDRKVTLSSVLPADLAQAYADQTRVRQILIILLDNAIKFTPEGGSVMVHARALPQDPRFLLLEVSDTGCGISPETAERIFERLYQVKEPVPTSRKGLGLGLYICKELVTRQGGRIWAERRQRKGSTFSFTLPVFSLYSTIAPLLRNDRWPAESVALVIVEASWPGAWPSPQPREAWAHEVRGILQRCLMPDMDVLLPGVSPGAHGERFFLAAFADDAGTSVLVNRIRGQLERAPGLKQAGVSLSVSGSMLEPWFPDPAATSEGIVAGMATRLIQAITSHIFPGHLS